MEIWEEAVFPEVKEKKEVAKVCCIVSPPGYEAVSVGGGIASGGFRSGRNHALEAKPNFPPQLS